MERETIADFGNGPLIEDEIERSKVGIMRALCEREDSFTKVPIISSSSIFFFCFFLLNKKIVGRF